MPQKNAEKKKLYLCPFFYWDGIVFFERGEKGNKE